MTDDLHDLFVIESTDDNVKWTTTAWAFHDLAEAVSEMNSLLDGGDAGWADARIFRYRRVV